MSHGLHFFTCWNPPVVAFTSTCMKRSEAPLSVTWSKTSVASVYKKNIFHVCLYDMGYKEAVHNNQIICPVH